MLVIVTCVTEQQVRSACARVWGLRIRTLRVEKCMTQADLAEAIAAATGEPLHRTAVAHWEKGRHEPALRHRKALAAVLGLPLSILFEAPAEVSAA